MTCYPSCPTGTVPPTGQDPTPITHVSLPYTGMDVWLLVGIAVAIIVLGLLTVLYIRETESLSRSEDVEWLWSLERQGFGED